MAKPIECLLALHRIDQELLDVERLSARLPADLAAAEQELAALESRKAELQAQARERQVTGDRANVEIKDIEGKREKYAGQLNIAKTQKEYDTLKGEMAAAQAEISERETAALTAYEEADALAAQARALDPEAEAVRRKLAAARAELDARLAELAERRRELEARRAGQAKAVDEECLKLYRLILSKHRDAAMVRLSGTRCSLCNISLTPQCYNLVLIGEKPQQCRSCGRICFSENGPGG